MRRLLAAAAVVLIISFVAYTQSTRTATTTYRAFYSAGQATRGKVLYGQYCSKCHLDSLRGKCPNENVSVSSPYVCAAPGNAPPLVGDAFMQRWYSVGDLYVRVRWSMPADNVGGLSADDNLAILAYVLQSNGLSAGRDLRDDESAMKRMVLKEKPATVTSSVKEPLNDLGVSEGYYTEQQAARGKNYYYGACGMCHTAEPAGPNGLNMPHDSGLGWHWGNQWRYAVQGGDRWLETNSRISGKPQMWDTVADLYNKIRTTQPAYAVAALSTEEYLAIVAYLLKQSGFPPGKEELTDDLNLMRNMTLEKGFQRLFNGKDLTGWGFGAWSQLPAENGGRMCADHSGNNLCCKERDPS